MLITKGSIVITDNDIAEAIDLIPKWIKEGRIKVAKPLSEEQIERLCSKSRCENAEWLKPMTRDGHS
jgi:vacuolar-type H+-ATPase subunit B/Vma2